MMPENKSPAIAALNIPLSVEDAAARIAEYTSTEYSSGCMSGLIGLVFYDINQFASAMQETGWNIDYKPFMKSDPVVTFVAIARRRDREVKLILHTYGDRLQVINVKLARGEEEELPQQVQEERPTGRSLQDRLLDGKPIWSEEPKFGEN